MSKLQNLDLSNNRLGTVKPLILNQLPDLKHLNLSANTLSSLTVDHFKQLHKLETLRLHDLPSLYAIPHENGFRYLRNLRQLYLYRVPALADAQVSRILANLPPLRVLHVEIRAGSELGDQLESADFRFLREIYVYGAGLKTLAPGAFRHLRGFRVTLGVVATQIAHFPQSLFHTLTRVSYLDLDLRNNMLQGLDPFPQTRPPILNKHGTTLSSINLAGNPLVCDCRLNWISPWMERLQKTLTRQEINRRMHLLNSTYCYPEGASYDSKPPENKQGARWSVGGLLGHHSTTCSGGPGSRRISPISMLAIHTALLFMKLFDDFEG